MMAIQQPAAAKADMRRVHVADRASYPRAAPARPGRRQERLHSRKASMESLLSGRAES
jgi:hypothetical protein